MATKQSVAELQRSLDSREALAVEISEIWHRLNSQRSGWLEEKRELRNYVFATDTRTTSNQSLPWKNSTTLPKLCQIRDNLHANYMAALFPNDDWMKWEGYTQDDEELEKRQAIQAYMENKTRMGGMYNTVSKLVYDYIDYGIAIADVCWVNETKVDPETDEKIPGFVGPMMIRVSPEDCVFEPTSIDFEHSYKVTRSLMTIGEFMLKKEQDEDGWMADSIDKIEKDRAFLRGYSYDDFSKAQGYAVDGFGSLHEYFRGGLIEVLEFEGTMYDPDTGEVLDDYIITVADRRCVVRKEPIPSWKRGGHKALTSWRKRPDNLYGMGPLDNLVGMQYRVDHLENLKADMFDLIAAPPLKIIGDVDEFDWGPFEQIHIAEGGDVQMLAPPSQALNADNQIAILLNYMEEFAGAPKNAMGIRTPGEKTAFEVQQLENAAGRIFQEKATQFEIELLEPILNNMLLVATKSMNGLDVIRVMDDDFGVADFMQIRKEDITASGKLRPVGARHFAARAQIVQNLTGIANSNIWPKIEMHYSGKELAKLIEDTMQLRRFSLVSDNIAVQESAETQRLVNQAGEDVETEAATPLPGGEDAEPIV